MLRLPRPHRIGHSAKLALLFLLLGISPGTPAASALTEAQDQLEQWVRLESQISREQHDWRIEKDRLEQLLKTLRQSKQTLTDKVDHLRDQTSRADDQRLALIARKRNLQERHKTLRVSLEALSQTLADQHKTLPEPLKKELAEDYQRYVFGEGSELSLLKRLAALTRMLGKIQQFDHEVSTHSGLLPLAGDDDETHQVDLLYLGLDHAFFIDRTGRYAGYGRRSSLGWQWRSEPTLAAAIRRAVAIAQGQQTETFVSLPFEIEAFEPHRDIGGSL